MKTLLSLNMGEKAVIDSLSGDNNFISRVISTGFTPLTEVTMVQNRRKGPLLVYLRDTHMAIGREEARRIIIGDKNE